MRFKKFGPFLKKKLGRFPGSKGSWPEERYVFVVLLACLRAFAYMLVLLFFHIIENCYLAAVRLSPCSVSFCFD